jgi:hypothetical protein
MVIKYMYIIYLIIDGIFILKNIIFNRRYLLKPIIKNGKFIELKIMFNKYNIIFRDSYLMLSLKSLAKQFNVDNKTLFTYNLLILLMSKSIRIFI